MFNSSFALEGDMENRQGDQMGAARIGENYNYNYSFFENFNNTNLQILDREMSRSVSDDDVDNASDQTPGKKKTTKKYHRHTPHQIQELESQCAHPDEKQRSEVSLRLNLDPQQVKFWFQNRRTQLKTQQERHENSLLRQENDRLRIENMSYKDAMRSPICSNCGSSAVTEISMEEQHLRIENARIKEELNRISAVTAKYLGQPSSSLDHSVNNLGSLNMSLPLVPVDFGQGQITQLIPEPTNNNTLELEGPVYLELALAAMDELLKLAQSEEPVWIRSPDGSGRRVLNQQEYSRMFNSCIAMKPIGFVTEASKETGVVLINSLALVETLMESNKWTEMFAGLVARATTTDVISDGMGGTRNGALHLMHAELQVVSPLVPVRDVNFLRFCKQQSEDVWAVVDVSIGEGLNSGCRRLPSGCIVQDMANGYSKVIWIEHAEYDESVIHPLYYSVLASGIGFGAHRWISTLQRQCESLVILMSSDVDHTAAISPGGRRSLLKLAQRMTKNFFAGVCASTVHNWNKLRTESVGEFDIRVMMRKSMDDPGEPSGIVVSAATSVWLPVNPHRLFGFLRNERLRSQWDILSNGGPMVEMAHIAKAHDSGNAVSLLRASTVDPNQSNMLILQETCSDASGAVVVYAPVDVPAMHLVMNGGDSAYVALLPSGFAVVPDGSENRGSLLTVGFQILVNSLPTANLTVESVATVNSLISCTVQKIKAAAIQCES